MIDATERARKIVNLDRPPGRRVIALAVLDYAEVLERCMGNLLFIETRERFEKAQRDFEEAVNGPD